MVSNGFLFAAAIPRDPKSLAIPETFDEQVRLTFRQPQGGPGRRRAGLDALVKINVYLSDMANWPSSTRSTRSSSTRPSRP